MSDDWPPAWVRAAWAPKPQQCDTLEDRVKVAVLTMALITGFGGPAGAHLLSDVLARMNPRLK